MDLQALLLNLNAAKQQERWSDLLQLSEAVLAVAPDRFQALEGRSLALSRLGRSAEALAACDHTVRVAEERLEKGLQVEGLVVSARWDRAAELAAAGRDAEAIADLKVVLQLSPKSRTNIKKAPAFSRVLKSQAGAELIVAPKKVRTAGLVVELMTRNDDEWLRSYVFSLGSAEEVIAVLTAEFGAPGADARKRALAAEAVLTLDQSFVARAVRKAEADEPVDLHAFVELFWNGAWHPLDAEALNELRERTFEQLRALELEFRIDEDALRDALPAMTRTQLKAGELLQVDAYEAFDGEDKVLQHGVHDLLAQTFVELDAFTREPAPSTTLPA